MRVLGIFALLLVAGSRLMAANDAQQILSTAVQQLAIRAEGARPFKLEADFHAQVKYPLGGHITMKWANDRLRWTRTTMGDYREVTVRDGDRVYRQRNIPFTPERIQQLGELLAPLSQELDERKIGKVKTQNGAECFDVSTLKWNKKYRVCVDSKQNDLLSLETGNRDESIRDEFADYRPFRDHRFPRSLKRYVNGSLILNVNVVSLEEAVLGDNDFTPEPDSIVRRTCKDMTAPRILKYREPVYPESDWRNGFGGMVTAMVTIGTDGSVEEVHLSGTATHEMDRVAQEAVKTWKFKPAMCGNEPVVIDVVVQVNFQKTKKNLEGDLDRLSDPDPPSRTQP